MGNGKQQLGNIAVCKRGDEMEALIGKEEMNLNFEFNFTAYR